jgi:hypothetical protein
VGIETVMVDETTTDVAILEEASRGGALTVRPARARL